VLRVQTDSCYHSSDVFFCSSCSSALCAPRCMNGGLCITPGLCICPPGFYGINCDKGNCWLTPPSSVPGSLRSPVLVSL